jgi:hypothetical protein
MRPRGGDLLRHRDFSAGGWIDRIPAPAVLIVADVGRAVALAEPVPLLDDAALGLESQSGEF